MIRVVGIDPSSKADGQAYAMLDRDGQAVTWREAGILPLASLTDMLIAATGPIGGQRVVIAVERPVWIPMQRVFNGQALVDTSYTAGRIVEFARGLAADVVELRMLEWRSALCSGGGLKGRGGYFGDDAVKRALELRVRSMPKKTNNHVRDAAGVAFVASLLTDAQRRERAA